ncbi:calcium-binding protein [Gemmobacter caeruleus]|uniref:calcium-binding protein n=1 Tax=Gemmobacter caeruleus TaxID=2595004 RepID=UPI001396AC56|nr:calcium-binding protein [Gemmobacter caeruleus]
MDTTYLFYMSLFALFLANSLDLFSGSSGDEDTDLTEHPLYDPAAYGDEIAGTPQDDRMAPEDGAENLAWLLDAGDDGLIGSAGADYADGGAGNDTLMMGDGNDIAAGQEGDDVIALGDGNDSAIGGLGDDRILGKAGNDAIAGQEGDDTLLGGNGADLIIGGEGDDFLSGKDEGSSQAHGATEVDGFDSLDGGAGNDTLLMGAGDRGTGGEGEDLFQIDHREDSFGQIAQVTDYGAGDRVELLYRPAYDDDGQEVAPEITVTANDEGTSGVIRFNDVVVAEVIGGQNLTTDDLVLTREVADDA